MPKMIRPHEVGYCWKPTENYPYRWSKFVKYGIRSPRLPLAVYREVAAHLDQISGVTTELVVQASPQFDYSLSQIDQLWIEHSDDLSPSEQAQLQRILAYYGDRYGAWEAVDVKSAEGKKLSPSG